MSEQPGPTRAKPSHMIASAIIMLITGVLLGATIAGPPAPEVDVCLSTPALDPRTGLPLDAVEDDAP